MDLNLVRTFLVVAEYQSFTKAAEKLDITQPAVSSAIKRLEKQYGQALFTKQGRGIELTTKGHQLVPSFRQALDIIENAMEMREHFNVYCNESILHCLQPFENVTLSESPVEKHQLFEHLRQQRVDLILDTMLTKENSFVIEEVHREPLALICRIGHPRVQDSLTKEAFYREKHVLYSGLWDNLRGFEQICREPIEEREIDIVSGSIAGMALYVSQSDSLGVISHSFAKKWAKTLNLQVLECPINTAYIPYHLVYHRRELKNPAHKALRDKIKRRLVQFQYNLGTLTA
ncbi:LysR family transcriptional regulator [Vibrio fluvialis]|nr:LysR family transcriptional regulator [Vibrio fluvialis]HDM8032812.1 LysR family transcriptional regulator [Vibrio fluvialis clinical-1]EKO3421372.1 LysR family transcriptional regulator [Vibrio fluvialis]EKO3521013.1 LysR family transcriptional regulator [Vibrio fluvialis]EKO3528096.1 LysR family transcriptional regulator [Vibrio fluvialis]